MKQDIDKLIGSAVEQTYTVSNKQVRVIREDLAYASPLPPNAKMSALWAIVQRAHAEHYTGVALFAKKQSGVSYAIGLPHMANALDMQSLLTYPITPKHKFPDWLTQTQTDGAEIVPLHPNMVSINVNQNRKLAEMRGYYAVPFGFDDALSIETHAQRFVLPSNIGTLVLSAMTGMCLAGAILHLQRNDKFAADIVGVSGGRDASNIFKTMRKYIDVPENVRIIDEYARHYKPNTVAPFDVHPDYELVAWHWLTQNVETLKEPIYFLNVGR